MVDYQRIYQERAADYDKMVSREDYLENLYPALAGICPLENAIVVELGCGTGRFARMLSARVANMVAVDYSIHMLRILTERIDEADRYNVSLTTGDNRRLPLTRGRADLALAGWTIGHLIGWHPDTWMRQVDMVLSEMERVLKPTGTLVILETLGTGRTSPKPPTSGLADYYTHLEGKWGYSKKWIRTDYLFESVEEATELTGFFFGEELATLVAESRSRIVPECTGIWWKKL